MPIFVVSVAPPCACFSFRGLEGSLNLRIFKGFEISGLKGSKF